MMLSYHCMSEWKLHVQVYSVISINVQPGSWASLGLTWQPG